MIEAKNSNAIVIIRVLAMVSILVCHILGTYGNDLCYMFNAGVQVFLVLSGYLYGQKEISDWKLWAIGRVKRLFVPIMIFLLLLLPLYMYFFPAYLSVRKITSHLLNLQGISWLFGTGHFIDGLNHLWFMTAIMFAYFTTPLLQGIRKYADYVLPVLCGCIGLGYLFVPQRLLFMFSWMYMYALGYLLANTSYKIFYRICVVVLLFIVLLISSRSQLLSFLNPFGRLCHDLIGVAVVFGGTPLLALLVKQQLMPIWNYLDKGSYFCYIVHYILLHGPFSVAHITNVKTVNIMVFIIGTFILTWVLYVITNKVELSIKYRHEN